MVVNVSVFSRRKYEALLRHLSREKLFAKYTQMIYLLLLPLQYTLKPQLHSCNFQNLLSRRCCLRS